MHIHMLLDHYAYVHDALMYDAYIRDPWYLTMLHVCMMRQILFRKDGRTNEQGDSRSRINNIILRLNVLKSNEDPQSELK